MENTSVLRIQLIIARLPHALTPLAITARFQHSIKGTHAINYASKRKYVGCHTEPMLFDIPSLRKRGETLVQFGRCRMIRVRKEDFHLPGR
jgi:hypothetical protein